MKQELGPGYYRLTFPASSEAVDPERVNQLYTEYFVHGNTFAAAETNSERADLRVVTAGSVAGYTPCLHDTTGSNKE